MLPAANAARINAPARRVLPVPWPAAVDAEANCWSDATVVAVSSDGDGDGATAATACL